MNIYAEAVGKLKLAINSAIEKAISEGDLPQAELPDFIIETPADRSHLDLEGTMCERFETAGPGFINFFLGSKFYSAVVNSVLENPETYGNSDFGKGEKVMVEFVSANPTGPMHMGNARGGALGDCLAAVLDKAGYNVWREFYCTGICRHSRRQPCKCIFRRAQKSSCRFCTS